MAKGDKLSRDSLRDELDKAGYRHVEQVLEHGEYATRGALLDLFPMGSTLPYRIDFLMMKLIACGLLMSIANEPLKK